VSRGELPLVTDTSTSGLVIGAGEFSGAVLTLAKTAQFFFSQKEHEILAWLCHRFNS
jgi:hypothetical protein